MTAIARLCASLACAALAVVAGCGPTISPVGEDAYVADAPDAASVGDAPAGCPMQRPLAAPSDSVTATLSGASVNRSTSCTSSSGTPGPEQLYPLHLDANVGVVLTATSDPVNRLAVAIRTACDDPLSEVACVVTEVPLPRPPDPPGAPRARIQTVLAPGDYVVLVDAIETRGDPAYTLTLETFAPADHGTCATALRVTDGTSLRDESVERAGALRLDCASSGGIDGPALWYAVTVPPRTRLRVTNTGGLSMAVVDACAATSCLPSTVDYPPAPAPAALTYDNASSAPTDVFVVVGALGPFPASPFDLAASLVPLPTGGTCDGALRLTSGVSVTGDAALGASATGCASGPTLYYNVTVPSETVLRVSLLPDSALGSPTVHLVSGGCDGTCVGETPEYPWRAAYRNVASAPVDLVVAVSAAPYTSLSQGFSMTATLEPMASNRTCALAAPLPLGTVVRGDSMHGAELRLGCDGTDERIGGASYYRVVVPSGETLRLSARGGSPVAVALFDGCAATCFARGAGDPTSFEIPNPGATPREIVAAVGTVATYAFVGAPFEIVAELGAAPANATCAARVPIGPEARLVVQDASIGTDDLSSRCVPESTTGTVYYAVTVPAGERLHATVRPAIEWLVGSWIPAIRLLDGCSASSCRASSQYVPLTDGQKVSLVYDNDSGADQSLVLAVSAAGSPAPGRFDLDVSVAPPAYRISVIAAACDDVSAVAPLSLPPEPGPPSVSARSPLPFAFAHFGSPVTHYLVSRDGWLQLQPEAGDVITTDGDPAASLPSFRAPRGVVAALWDDLAAGATGAVRVATLGAAPTRRVVVEWSGYRYAGDPSGGPLRFQAKLFEGSDLIELHYCSLGASLPPWDHGGRATIGTQDLTTTDGALFSFSTPGIDSGTALRFTPR